MASLLKKIGTWLPVGKVDEIEVHELQKLLTSKENVQLLDVRTLPEWKAGHIKGAINVPIIELGSKMHTLDFDKDVLLVPICLSAHRSIPAVRLFKEKGFKDVRQLAGGMRKWNKHYKHQLVKK